jgi:hypothetical protein
MSHSSKSVGFVLSTARTPHVKPLIITGTLSNENNIMLAKQFWKIIFRKNCEWATGWPVWNARPAGER